MKKKAKSKNPKRSKSVKPAATSADVGAATSAASPAEPSNTPAEAKAPATAPRKVKAKKPKAAAKPVRKRAARKVTKRYSPEAKAEILQFVRNHDSANGRGGKSAAVREFGVSALSLSNWLKASKSEAKPTKARMGTTAWVAKFGKGRKSAGAGIDGISGIEKTLKRMLEIRNQIGALKAEFEALKARI